MKKLRYGQGTISKKHRIRPNGDFYTWYEGKVSKNGQVRYVTAKTKQECYNKLMALTGSMQELPGGTRYTLQQWLQQWLRVYKQDVAKTTLQDYRQAIATYLAPLHNRQLQTLRTIELQQVINDVAAEYPRRARTLYDILRGSLTEAWNNDYISKDVAKALKRPSYQSKEETPLTDLQQTALVNLQDEVMRQVLTAYLWSGCRFSELLTLKPEYWNKQNNTLFIAGTKTKTSRRTIPVFEPLRAVLERLPTNGEYLFQISEKTLKRRKQEVEKLVGFNFTFKALRHTFNQNLTEMGVVDIVRAAWMGHSKPTTTKKTYTHLTNKLQNEAIEVVRKALDNAP